MHREQLLQAVMGPGVVAILRTQISVDLVKLARALQAGGIQALEITFTMPKALRQLEQLADQVGDSMVIGAGTILDPETARAALLAGAQFIVSPTTDPKTIEMTRRYDKLSFPGAFTPTEILTAWQAGADVVKIFPSDFTGPEYFRAVLRPLPQIRLMPTGGVDLQTAGAYLKAGACAIGALASLMPPKMLEHGDFNGITELAKQFVEVVARNRLET
ncbi:MAG: bifunctional 4-hydroxy-2-oxoglutarate aldolase/2-dehydro-3-deoxy-phosphogluconate aldolase [Planctomycetaceae bacterium]|nr:bifunctional 4-hydroxy-2-oxoglutarate aldolase/2-dehydro-3-deoxy-phosphogluconate aldolase [Planctomycetaceae bacterium]MBN8603580.1 bifunctional 4-hydroxy-2-oxoglutarate aldolase/2-dehydro-3-deoxy-phosphogluconate aldolase [Planctomycetota bacterium]